MAGGYRYSICFFTCSVLLLFGISLHDVEASNCQHVIHKKVGDTAELPSCSPTEGVTDAVWKYGGNRIADKYNKVADEKQFKGRLNLNPTNFSLTIRELTLKDSGNFSFVSAVNAKQRPTVTITLHVHEPIAERPVITGNSTWHNLNRSCTVLLECSTPTDSSVSYKWTMRNQTINGSMLQHVIKIQDGDTKFTCTVYNFVSEMSASKTVKCSNDTKENVSSSSSTVLLSVGSVIGILLIIPLLLLCYTKFKDRCCNRVTQSQTVSHDEATQHVYSSLLHGDGSVYETVRGSGKAGTGEPDNLYSNITVHLND